MNNRITFALQFFRGNDRKSEVFTINVAPYYGNNHRTAALDHVAGLFPKFKDMGLSGWLPCFDTITIAD